MQLIRSLLVAETPAEADALTWITDAPVVIRNARKNTGSNQRERKEVKVMLCRISGKQCLQLNGMNSITSNQGTKGKWRAMSQFEIYRSQMKFSLVCPS